jgi:Holliday junction resolvasome RuvABC ATP-dependent DNA helicase subunit
MVTRTVSFIRCEIMALDTVNGTVQTVTVDYTGLQKQDDRILKDIKKTWQNDDVALVKITSKEEIEQLYGMREEDFIRYATPMESRTSKI